MSDEVKTFIDKLATGNNAEAGEAFKDALRAKVGDALEVKRQDMAANLFNATPYSDSKPVVLDPSPETVPAEMQQEPQEPNETQDQ
jgi:hypothetical protein